jgi:hypothetical protein
LNLPHDDVVIAPVPHLSASDLIRVAVIGRILRVTSFLRLEWLAHSRARAAAPFGDDVLAVIRP